MINYKDVNNNSGIESYKFDDTSITVRFKESKKDIERNYLYTYELAGHLNIERMKKLAIQGFGLNTFINMEVKSKYAKKW